MNRKLKIIVAVTSVATMSWVGPRHLFAQNNDLDDIRKTQTIPGYPQGAELDLPKDYRMVNKNGFVQMESMPNYTFRKIEEQNKRIEKLEKRIQEIQDKIGIVSHSIDKS